MWGGNLFVEKYKESSYISLDYSWVLCKLEFNWLWSSLCPSGYYHPLPRKQSWNGLKCQDDCYNALKDLVSKWSLFIYNLPQTTVTKCFTKRKEHKYNNSFKRTQKSQWPIFWRCLQKKKKKALSCVLKAWTELSERRKGGSLFHRNALKAGIIRRFCPTDLSL